MKYLNPSLDGEQQLNSLLILTTKGSIFQHQHDIQGKLIDVMPGVERIKSGLENKTNSMKPYL